MMKIICSFSQYLSIYLSRVYSALQRLLPRSRLYLFIRFRRFRRARINISSKHFTITSSNRYSNDDFTLRRPFTLLPAQCAALNIKKIKGCNFLDPPPYNCLFSFCHPIIEWLERISFKNLAQVIIRYFLH